MCCLLKSLCSVLPGYSLICLCKLTFKATFETDSISREMRGDFSGVHSRAWMRSWLCSSLQWKGQRIPEVSLAPELANSNGEIKTSLLLSQSISHRGQHEDVFFFLHSVFFFYFDKWYKCIICSKDILWVLSAGEKLELHIETFFFFTRNISLRWLKPFGISRVHQSIRNSRLWLHIQSQVNWS